MSEEENGRLLDPEELRELLGEASETIASPAHSHRALVVSPRRDVHCVAAVLHGLGFDARILRDPFVALDHLRWRRHALLVTDLDIWPQGGAFLFRRLREAGDPVAVILMGDRAEELEERALRAGAAGILARPFGEAEVESAVRVALGAAGRELPPLQGRASSPAPGTPATLQGGEGGDGPPEPGLGSAAPDAERAWLRFFFAARKAIRALSGVAPRAEALLAELHRHLRPRWCAIALESAQGWRLVLELPRVESGTPASFPEAAERLATALGAHASGQVSSASVPVWVRGRSTQRWCAFELPPGSQPPPPEYTEELALLLDELDV